MALTTHSGYLAAAATALGTELNALANTSITAAGTAIDNTTSLALYADFVLNLPAQASNRAVGAKIELYFAYAIDGTNYDTLLAGLKQPAAVFTLNDGVLSAVQTSVVNVEIPPGLWKPYAKNLTGQTLAATLNTIKYRFHSVQTQ